MFGSGKFVSTHTGSPASFFGSQSKQPLTEEICLLSETTTYIYFLIEIDEKDTKLSLFYLMHPANSNSHENRVFSRDLSAFYRIFNSFSTYSFAGETIKTATHRRNLSTIGSDDIHISSYINR